MSNGRILIVEPDENIRDQLITTLTALGYEVEVLQDDQSLLDVLNVLGKQLILFSAAVPDAPEQLKNLHSSRFRHVPYAITAFHRNFDHAEKIAVFEWGNLTYDFLSIEHLPILHERIDQIFEPYKYSKKYQAWLEHRRQHDAFEALLTELIASDRSWAYFDIRLKNLEEYTELYGWQAQSDVLDVVGEVITTVQMQHGTENDQWYVPGTGNWVGIVFALHPKDFIKVVQDTVLASLKAYYKPVDWERGYMLVPDQHGAVQECSLIHFTIGMLTPKQDEYKSVTDLIEAGGEKRRSSPIFASW